MFVSNFLKNLVKISLLPLTIFGVTATWKGGGNSAISPWNTESNWSPGGIPNGKDDIAFFTNPTRSSPILNSSVTLGTLQFGPGISTTITGSVSKLTFEGTAPSIEVNSPGNVMNLDVSLMNDLKISLSTLQSSLDLNGKVDGTGSLTIDGLGTLFITGGLDSPKVILNSGTVKVNSTLEGFGVGIAEFNGGTYQSESYEDFYRNLVLTGSPTFIPYPGSKLRFWKTISGNGSFVIDGSGTVDLLVTNTYTGGTVLKSGILNVSKNELLGDPLASLTIEDGTVQTDGTFSFSSPLGIHRPIKLTGKATIASTTGNTVTIGGNIGGTGSLTVTGPSTLQFAGVNTYTGPTMIQGSTLKGTSNSIQGDLNIENGSVVFDQSFDGAYSGTLTGPTATNPSSLIFEGGGTYIISGQSPGYKGDVSLSSSNLILNGTLGAKTFSIQGNQLSGNGTLISSINGPGTILPGRNGQGTLTIDGDITEDWTLISELTPVSSGLLDLKKEQNLTNVSLVIRPLETGFYGIKKNYTLFTGDVLNNPLKHISITDPRFSPLISYSPSSVHLTLINNTPFLNFPFENRNEKAVGQNLDALSTRGLLREDLTDVIDSLANQGITAVNRALDQMHPAALSAYGELLMNLRGKLFSTFEKGRASLRCKKGHRMWITPFGNWFGLDSDRENIGFEASTKGISGGYDTELLEGISAGIGGGYEESDLRWSKNRGYGYLKGGYGFIYSDFHLQRSSLKGAIYGGKTGYHTVRHIHFTTIDRQPSSENSGFDMGTKLNYSYRYGTNSFSLSPYVELDYLFLKNSSFTEKGAGSLNLTVDGYKQSTVRGQTGLTFRCSNANQKNTAFISPLLMMGYTIQAPLLKGTYSSRFENQSIPYTTYGWDKVWQLISLQLGLEFRYQCFLMSGMHFTDFSIQGNSVYKNQRLNLQLAYQF